MISGFMFHVVWPTKEHHFPEVRLCIPEKHVPYVLHKYHEELVAGHQGVNRTYHTIRQHFWFPRMYNTIITYIKSCHRCQEAKEPAKLPIASFARIPVNFHPFDWMSMDVKCMVKSRSGFTKILVMNCLITQCTELTPIKEMNAKQVIDLLLTKVFYHWGKPSLIVMDQDPSFTGHLVRMLVQRYQVQVQFIGVHNHGTNPTEWYIQSMNNIFCKFLNEAGRDWPVFLQPVVYAMNTSVCPRIGFSPYKMMFIQKPPDLSGLDVTGDVVPAYRDQAEEMDAMFRKFKQMEKFILAEKQRQQELQKVEAEPALCKGNLVMFKGPHLSTLQANSRKLVRPWVGPVIVQAILGPNKYLVVDWAGKLLPQVFERHELKPYHLRYVNLKNPSQELALAMDEADAALKEWGEQFANSVYPQTALPVQGCDTAAAALPHKAQTQI